MVSPWNRLRQARLVRVIITYLAASWLILEVTALLREEFQLPQWVTPLAVVLLLIGFVVVVATAWVQADARSAAPTRAAPAPWEVDLVDLKESVTRGRFPHLTWARAILGGLVAFSLLFGFAGAYVLVKQGEFELGSAEDAIAAPAPGIAVLPFRAIGLDRELWREGMIDILSRNFEGTVGLRKIDPRAVVSHWRRAFGEGGQAGDDRAALQVARDLGASYAVIGSMIDSGTGVRLIAQVYDVESGALRGSVEVEGSADSLLALADRLSVDVLRTGLVPAATDQPDVDLSRATTSSLAALRAYLEGEQSYRRSRPEEAIRNFTRAIEADSNFAVAHFRLALSHRMAGTTEKALGHAERAARVGSSLPERETLLLRATTEYARGDLAAIETLSRLTSRYPDDVEGWYLLGRAYFDLGAKTLHPRERASAAFERAIELSPQYGPAYPAALRLAFFRQDSTEVAELLKTYRLVDSTNDYCVGFEVAFGLAWGDRTAAAAALDTVPAGALQCTTGALTRWPELAALVSEALQRRVTHEPSNFEGLWGLSVVRVYQGRVSEAREALARAPPNPFAAHLARLSLITELATYRDTIDAMNPLAVLGRENAAWHRFAVGVLAARAGRWTDVEHEIDRLESSAHEAELTADTMAADEHRAYAAALRGYASLRRGDAEGAAAKLEIALPRLPLAGPGLIRTYLHEFLRLEMGKLLLARGEARQAKPYFESFWTYSSPYTVLSDYYLGSVYEALDEPDPARRHYGRFARWYENCDPQLRPLLDRSRQALARLTAEPR